MAPHTHGSDPQEGHHGQNPARLSGSSSQSVMATDFDDDERTETKFRQDQQELRRVVDLIPQAIVVLNPHGKAIFANRVALLPLFFYSFVARSQSTNVPVCSG
jgi:PAS domain-containing protein